MFDVSWGELAVLFGGGLLLVGRRDLPPLSRAVGHQVGRIVGFLQGARLRADRFATDHQLKKLQNEFRSGLRELDAVKAELAGSMMASDRGLGGMGNLGATVPGVDRRRGSAAGGSPGLSGGVPGPSPAAAAAAAGFGKTQTPTAPTSASSMGAEYLAAAQAESSQHDAPPIASTDDAGAVLAPRSQSVAAVAEEEWEKRGIGFRSVAEGRGARHGSSADAGGPHAPPVSGGVGGAVILADYMRQSLIYDQYERTVREQDEALRSRVEKVRNERLSSDESKKGR
ncbi:hypothetical protein ACHAWF_007701 [Thalassiosira exigua]